MAGNRGFFPSVLQQLIDVHSYCLSPPAVLAYELDVVFSPSTPG